MLDRPALHEAIDAGAALPVTTIVGRAGSGKTAALVGYWNRRLDANHLWISCDARDSDPATFWSSVVMALGARWPDRFSDAVDLLEADVPDPRDVAIAVVNELSTLHEPLTLILDDFMFASAAGPSLAFVIDRMPDGARVVLACRSDPEIGLARLRVRGLVQEIRQELLDFNLAETSALFASYGIALDEAETAALSEGTGGWVAAQQLAALSIRAGSEVEKTVAKLSHSRALSDYLVGDVLDRLDADTRAFVFETSIIEQLDARTCDAVRESSDSARMLQQVEDANLFLVRTASDGVYRYHDLFGELLQAQLRASDPVRELALHERAARWYESEGRYELAFHHLLRSEDVERAFELLGERAVAVYFGSDARALDRMLVDATQFASRVGARAKVDVALALALVGRLDQADSWLDVIATAARAGHVPVGRLLLVRSLIASFRGLAEEAEALADEAESLTDDDDLLFGVLPSVRVNTRLWLGDDETVREVYRTAQGHGFYDPALMPVLLQGACAWSACVEGSLHEAEELANRALEASERLGLSGHPSTGNPLRARGRIAYEHSQMEEAESWTERALTISERRRPCFAVLDLLVLARIWSAGSHFGQAVEAIAHAREVLEGRAGPLADLCTAAEGRLALLVGDLERAAERAAVLPAGNPRSLLRARVALEKADREAAVQHLDECTIATKRQRLDAGLLRLRCDTSLDEEEFSERLDTIVAIAREEGYVQPLVEELREFAGPLARTIRARSVGEWDARVLRVLDRALPNAVVAPNGTLPSQLLSPRELQVLQYLPSRLTSSEIADELCISRNTLRTHVSAIYRKLGVSSRRQALETARGLGLTTR